MSAASCRALRTASNGGQSPVTVTFSIAISSSSRALEKFMLRLLCGLLAAFYALTGLFILADGRRFYELPDVMQTGPFNPHFMRDIGAATLVAGMAIASYAWRPRYRPAAVVGTALVAAHALIHVVEISSGMDTHAGQTLMLVIVPAILAIIACMPWAGELHA
jgi:hypothetical protein